MIPVENATDPAKRGNDRSNNATVPVSDCIVPTQNRIIAT
jgi:hypothetical protein